MVYYHSRYNKSQRRKKSRLSRFVYILLLVGLLAALAAAYYLYNVIFKPNTWAGGEQSTFIYIPTASTFNDLETILYGNGIVVNRKSFDWLARRKNLPKNIKPGKYQIQAGMSNNELINLLRSGQQTPINLIINSIRTKEDFARKISKQIEPDSLELITLLNDTLFLSTREVSPESALTLVIPNTYEVYWDITATELFDRMYTEYKKFWTPDRLAKAAELNMTPEEVYILASIVEKETNKNDEKAAIAGVYINRLKYNWRLQADPTVVFAWGDFSIRRVLNVHKQIDSPYNTYIYYGLPPGPIYVPSIASIDAVLNAEDHSFMFFCAKDDFSGYHVFSSTSAGHIINANKYRRALDQRNIRN
ncbi:MAG: endolytic transglycosylase MltG [Bacteroidales bacterium]|nr:endolytic transglycosylase MltG [Bacteroidales bacterium]